MNITEISFFIFLGVFVLFYYCVPLRFRFLVILAGNAYYLYQSNTPWMLVVWLVTVLITYAFGYLVGGIRENRPVSAKVLSILGVGLVIGLMIGLKDIYIGLDAPLGISYYSLIWVGYLIEVYCGTCRPEKNIVKFLAFCGYFPLYTAGPILKYEESANEIIVGHRFCYRNFTFGLQRLLWGLMKKLIISERLAIVVTTVYEDSYAYPGFFVWIAMISFVFQLYTDFSGCIDIVLGVSEMLGITLPENFNLPFMARTMSDFWRRWHITLGGWLRDYCLYPILKSGWMQAIGKRSKKIFGKKFGKNVPTWIGLLISWFLIGFWHGGRWNYILGVGLFCGIVIITSEMLAPVFDKMKKALRVREESFSYRFFQRIRTLLLFTIALSFFRSYNGLEEGFTVWRNGLTVYNPWIFADGSLLKMGLNQKDMNILILFGLILAVSGIISYFTKRSLRELIAEQGIVFRWALYLFLLYSIIIYGCYGIEFDSAAFIYQRF